ncbi:MAG: TetR/AcrR family transcriptional regulator [Solirubrobacterales bacterium]
MTRRTYAGESDDARRARRRQELLTTALVILAERGRDGLSIDALCNSAALNKRYFYESFPNLDQLVAELMSELASEAIEAALAELPQGRPDEDSARPAVSAFIEYLTDDPRRGRVLFGAVPAGDAAAEHRNVALRRIITTVAEQGRDMYELDSDARIDIAAAIMVGGASQAVLDWLDGRVGGTRDELVDELVSTWLAMADATVARLAGAHVGVPR